MPDRNDANKTGLLYALESTLAVRSSPVWKTLEPNTYPDFGGEYTKVARNPINASRQRLKGNITDLDAVGGFNQDLTVNGIYDLLPGFFFADWDLTAEEVVTGVDDAADDYDVASTTGFLSGSLIWASNFPVAGNNGLTDVTGIVADTSVEVSKDLAADTPTADSQIKVVGHQAAADDIDVANVASGLGDYTSTILDFTTLGLAVGQWIFVGGDAAATTALSTAGNNGFKRISAIAANTLSVDKSEGTMANETSSGSRTLQIFFCDYLKNQNDPANIVRKTFTLERTLDAGGAEYIEGAVPNTLGINIGSADKISVDLNFAATNYGTNTAGNELSENEGTKETLVSEEFFNSSSNIGRVSIYDATNNTALAAFVTELNIQIDNGVTPAKAVATLGAFDMTTGDFTVTGTTEAYFGDVSLQDAVRTNVDVTIDIAMVVNNAGHVWDIPLCTVSDGKNNVEKDASILTPLTIDAAKDADFSTTLALSHFTYLPDLAET